MAAAVGVVTVLARRQGGIPVSLTDLPISARVANAFTAYGWYVAHSVVPVRLCALYLHPVENWSVPAVLAGAGLLVAGTLLAAWQARRRRWLIVGWLWFVVTLLPVIGFAQGGAQAWADRFCYWPHIGLFVVAVWGLAELAGRLRLPARVVAGAAAVVVGAFAAMAWVQVGYWHDTVTVWERTLAVTGDNHIAQMHLGKYDMEQGRFDEAVAHWSEAVRLSPRVNDYRCALGLTLLSMGRLDEADAQYRGALGRDPGRTDAWYNLGIVKLRMGKPDRAERCFRQVLELEPESADDLAMLGQAVWRQGRRPEGVEVLERALARDSRQADAWHGLGVAYLAQGRGAEAIEALQQTLRYNPRQLSARSELGVALGRAGRWGEAVPCHLEAVQTLDRSEKQLAAMGGRIPDVDGIPQLVLFQCRLAYALHFCGQQRAAVEFYRAAGEHDPRWPEQFAAKARQLAADPDPGLRDPQQACELAEQAVAGVADPPADLLDTLAVALAARGDFDEATRTGQQALDKATAAGDITVANGIRDRLLLYQERKPVPRSCP
jgi:tetratricopeptide (TPR) repeat protein